MKIVSQPEGLTLTIVVMFMPVMKNKVFQNLLIHLTHLTWIGGTGFSGEGEETERE